MSHPFLERVEAVRGAVDHHHRAGGAGGENSRLAQPVVRQAIVQERVVGARHVEHQAAHTVKIAGGVCPLERNRELHLRLVAVVHDRLQPGRLPMELHRGVGDRLAAEVKHDRVIGGEVDAFHDRCDVVKFRVDLGPFVGADLDGVGRERRLVEEIAAAAGGHGRGARARRSRRFRRPRRARRSGRGRRTCPARPGRAVGPGRGTNGLAAGSMRVIPAADPVRHHVGRRRQERCPEAARPQSLSIRLPRHTQLHRQDRWLDQQTRCLRSPSFRAPSSHGIVTGGPAA